MANGGLPRDFASGWSCYRHYGAAGGPDQAADGAQDGRKSHGRHNGEQKLVEAERQQRRAYVRVGHIQRTAGHRSEAEEPGQDVEETDGGDADHGAFSGADLVLDDVGIGQSPY